MSLCVSVSVHLRLGRLPLDLFEHVTIVYVQIQCCVRVAHASDTPEHSIDPDDSSDLAKKKKDR